jgi:hypothetical protein
MCKSHFSISFESDSRLTRIESEAFSSSSLESIEIPRTVEILGSSWISKCKCKFNSSYSQSGILEPLSEWRSGQAGAAGGTLMVHADNARPHTGATSQQFMEENGMARAPHQPYSQNLAPSDFYLIGFMKHCLRGQSVEAADELFSAIEGY